MEKRLRKWKPTLVDRSPLVVGTLLFLVTINCSVTRTGRTGSLPTGAEPGLGRSRPLLVENMKRAVEGEISRHLGDDQAAVLTTLAQVGSIPANFKHRLVLDTFADPWRGMKALEQQGHLVARQKELATLIGMMERGMDRLEDPAGSSEAPQEASLEKHLDFIVSVLEQAQNLRALALQNLSPEDRHFLFEYSAQLAENYYVHVDELDESSLRKANQDLRFFRLINHQLNYPRLVTSAQVLAQLADEEWLRRAAAIFMAQGVPSRSLPAIQGEILMVEDTSAGRIIIGGPGPNEYDLGPGIALVIDLGGNDTYRGKIAAPVDIQQGNRVVIDLAGNDTYHASRQGLATGRLGVGLLIDKEGDDRYHLSLGTGGAGFAGLGILLDLSGNDLYQGDRLTQGAAIGGLGLLWDRAGNDAHTSFGYAQGFGGPLGIGTLMDGDGDDLYQCGNRYPSSYNETDAPSGDPDDPLFQYDGFCMGFGSGTLYRDPQQKASALAGGWGMMIDVNGDDRYQSANFSQGTGYFFGAGIKLDLAGNDQHAAARYGQGTAAHFGVGLFIDSQGGDHYTSTGPVYNGGSAWDRSVTLFIDGGPQADFYHSFGLGHADQGSWSLSIEEGGLDHYLSSQDSGVASDNSIAGFFDLSGEDEYAGGSRDMRNTVMLLDAKGGLFLDR